MTIYDQARALANRTGRTLTQALAELGRRGGRKRRKTKRTLTQMRAAPAAYWWQQLD